ncbi:MAG: hypothetical protein WEB52_02550 [Dehalococcoidia bacterium]
MVHVGIGFVIVALTCVGLTAISFVAGPDVSTPFAVGSFVALGTSGAFLAYVLRHRM